MRNGHKNSGHNNDVGASKSNESMRWAPPEKDVDPVCKKVVYTEKSKPSVHDGDVYYFCSRECREIFEAAPDLYIIGIGVDSKPPRPHLEEGDV